MIKLGEEEIVPIRGIPLHTGNFVTALDVAGLLADPESFGEMLGTGLLGYYLDKLGSCHRMYPYEFTNMHREVAAAPDRADRAACIAMLMPMVLVFRKDLDCVLHGFWNHYAARGAALDRGEFEFNPAPRMTAEEELLIYAGFEKLLTNGKVEPGGFLTPEDRRKEADRILRRLVHLAAENHIPFDLGSPPGRMANMLALLRRQSRAFEAIQDDALAGYVNQFGCRFKSGRPSKTAHLDVALYTLM